MHVRTLLCFPSFNITIVCFFMQIAEMISYIQETIFGRVSFSDINFVIMHELNFMSDNNY